MPLLRVRSWPTGASRHLLSRTRARECGLGCRPERWEPLRLYKDRAQLGADLIASYRNTSSHSSGGVWDRRLRTRSLAGRVPPGLCKVRER